MNKKMIKFIFSLYILTETLLPAQEAVTNAFDDLDRKGTVKGEFSEMCCKADSALIQKLLADKPASGFFCFTEDRMYDIRLNDAIPARWATRTRDNRNLFTGTARPGEFYTWQIGVYSPFDTLDDIKIWFSDLKNTNGEKIKASAMKCFNTDGTDKSGKTFHKHITIEKGHVQALWIGVDIPGNAKGLYTGKVHIADKDGRTETVRLEINVTGEMLHEHGYNESWRKARLNWLDSTVGHSDKPTAPYTPLKLKSNRIHWLGGTVDIAEDGLPVSIITHFDANNSLSPSIRNAILADKIRFLIEASDGYEKLSGGKVRFTQKSDVSIKWESVQSGKNFKIVCKGEFGFDGIAEMTLEVIAKRNIEVHDIKMEIPYTGYASKYMMGLGHKGGIRPDSLISWKWDVNRHQDKIWMGNVNAGMNIRLKDNNFKRPLVNIYYSLGKLNLPKSWGNEGKGGILVIPEGHEQTRVTAYSGESKWEKDEVRHFNFTMQITPVKPIDFGHHICNRFYHANNDLSSSYIEEATKNGANLINIHHKKEIYPFINYPYHDAALNDLKKFIQDAHKQDLGVRLYYTTREITVKLPELWALRSLGNEIICDGPGKDTRTLIHKNGPDKWLNENLVDHFIPAWYNAFKQGKFAGDMDISVITTPDSRWNNYYLAGLDWMIDNLEIDGIYIDDSALDRETIRRARRILDKDGKERLIDMHSWNHMNQWAGYANSLHIYTELMPYIDRTWIGEGFNQHHTPDFWLVEMSGIPFGLLSETLDAVNQFKGLSFGMLPRLPWSGNPVPAWKMFDEFGTDGIKIHGFWDSDCPVMTDNSSLTATVYTNGNKALVIIANWSELPQKAKITINEASLGFKPSHISLPEVRNLQWGGNLKSFDKCEILGRSGMIVLLEE